MRLPYFKLAIIILLSVPIGPALSAAEADSLRTASERFAWQKLAVPTVIFSAGVAGTSGKWFQAKINQPLRDFIADIRGDHYLHFDDYTQYLPSAAYLGLGFAVRPEHGFAERTLAVCTAWAATVLIVQPLKYAVDEMRPDASGRNSFPSGHAAKAFVGAELVRLEYGNGWGAAAYGIAVTTALMRVYNDRHWFNDLLGGAAVGIFAANAAYWLLPLERRLLRLEKDESAILAVPYCDGLSAGFSLAMRF